MIESYTSFRLIKLVTISVLTFLSGHVFGQTCSIEGTLTYRAYAFDKVTIEIQRSFSAEIGGSGWSFKIQPAHELDGKQINSLCSLISDGANIYCLGIPISGGTTQALASVYINQTPPSPPTYGATFAWLAVDAGARNGVLTNRLGNCVWDDFLLRTHHVSLKAQLETNVVSTNAFSETLYWQNDGNLRYEDQSGTLRLRKWPEPFSRGYTNAIFVGTYTNMDGIIVPLGASLTSYTPNYPREVKFPDLIAHESYFLSVTSISNLAASSEFFPNVPPMTTIKDFRLSDVHPEFKPFMVLSNGGRFKAISMDQLKTNYSSFLANNKVVNAALAQLPSEHVLKIRRQLIVGCMVLVSLITCATILRFFKKKADSVK